MICNDHRDKEDCAHCPHCLAAYWEDRYNALRQQLADSQNQVVMLRDALKYSRHQCEGLRVWGGMSWSYHPFQVKQIFDACEKALAATADLKDVILCHAKPMAWTYDKGPIIDVGAKIPLYRAWEPKK